MLVIDKARAPLNQGSALSLVLVSLGSWLHYRNENIFESGGRPSHIIHLGTMMGMLCLPWREMRVPLSELIRKPYLGIISASFTRCSLS